MTFNPNLGQNNFFVSLWHQNLENSILSIYLVNICGFYLGMLRVKLADKVTIKHGHKLAQENNVAFRRMY